MNENQYKPIYDLEERTFQFAKKVKLWVKKIPKTVENIETGKYLFQEATELKKILSSIELKSK
ncbi:MAG TPA: hypothetical protein VK872_13635 [Draconibacterium sp.]|nr:hypothetical protein [Draconibacterium sp.]